MKLNNNYIMRMLVSYLPILCITISVLIFIFFSIINQFNVRNAIQANKLTAEYITNMVDSSLKNISIDVQKMAETGGDLERFLETTSDRALNFEASNQLSNLMVRYGLIDSVYLYRVQDGHVLDQSTIRPLDQFPDRSFVRFSLDQAYTGVWSSPRVREMTAQGSPAQVRVTSLGFKIPRDTGSLGYLMVNVKISSLSGFIGQMIDHTITDAQLYDAKGNSFFHAGQTAPSKNRLSADVVSDYTGWTYRISIKGGQLLDFLFHGSTLWVLLGLCAIILAIGSMFYVTRRNYKPIESILHRIDRFSSIIKTEPKEKDNEFAFIDQAIERLITNNMAFQEQQQEHMVIRRQQFLQMLLKGEYKEDQAAWEQEWQHFGLSAGHFMVALLELDQYVQFGLKYSPSDQSLFKFIVSSVAQETAEQNGLKVIVEWIAKNQLVILLIAEEGMALEHQLLHLSEQIRAWVEGHLDFTVTIGIGTPADDEASIARSFEDAEAAVSRKVSVGVNQIIDALEVKGNPDREWFDYLKMIRTIVRQLRMSDGGWPQELSRLFHEMTVHRMRKDDVDRLVHYFIFHLEYELGGALPEAMKPWQQEVKPRLAAAAEQSDTLGQVEQDFLGTLTKLATQIEELSQNRRHNALMREIRDYVAEQYLDPNLSLTILSERFQISPKYLSQLFKESIGQNFSDFLIGLRIEYAKRLLRESDVTVQQISEMLGYANPTSFIRVFKKIVGLSPGQYRESEMKSAERIEE
ncbi:YesN/AraC family two-component response regulator [Paenibacillus phyllosphaerae]|uniref:YesN/AraC family two-component response regulator n=1 Tax=Paenibacillus phyllosphaerae TaxID=274593 RepID=A0A7W5AZB0_9BACL|nr:helix-turn-helix domain-containing protein [Paenibacillus phyllosphaerae]MBB3111547.1 YesN/AraC family two-component response regulator [Paenibacillus phyllosphaerae]